MKRALFGTLVNHLARKQITLLVGARQVGKTTLLKQLEQHLKDLNKPVFLFTLEDLRILELLNEDPRNLFQLIPNPDLHDKMYILIDEIQYLDNPSNFLKLHYDTNGDCLKFIVTGSSHFYIDQKFSDSLAGRKRMFELPVMSLEEVLHFHGRDDLATYVGQPDIPLLYKDELLHYLYDYMVYGGYPDVVLANSIDERRDVLAELRNSYAKKDIPDSGIRHPDIYLNLMKIIADQIGGLLNSHHISGELGIDSKTVKKHVWVMRKSFHIYLASPFHQRVASELRKMPKVYFSDLGLRNSLLNNYSPIGERKDHRALLENYVYLCIHNHKDEEHIKYWRTQNQQEVDFIVQDTFGKQAAYEVKYSARQFNPTKYKYFQEQYPDIPLQCISLDNVIEFGA